jgi:hypothetical protein
MVAVRNSGTSAQPIKAEHTTIQRNDHLRMPASPVLRQITSGNAMPYLLSFPESAMNQSRTGVNSASFMRQSRTTS